MPNKTAKPSSAFSGAALDNLFKKSGNVEAQQPTQNVAIASIVLPPFQPRKLFPQDSIDSLTQSIATHGVLEPLLLRLSKDSNEYELICGERRLRAAKLAELSEVPAVILEVSDLEAQQIRLVENLQREDLNPLDETEGILSFLAISLESSPQDVAKLLQRMLKAYKASPQNMLAFLEAQTIEEAFISFGRMNWQSFVRNRLPLLRLPQDLLDLVRVGTLDYTKAKILNKIKDPAVREELTQQVLAQQLSRPAVKALVVQNLPQDTDTSKTEITQREAAISTKAQSLLKKLRSPNNLSPEKQEEVSHLLLKLDSILQQG